MFSTQSKWRKEFLFDVGDRKQCDIRWNLAVPEPMVQFPLLGTAVRHPAVVSCYRIRQQQAELTGSLFCQLRTEGRMIDSLRTPLQTPLECFGRFPGIVQQTSKSPPISRPENSRKFFGQLCNTLQMLGKRLPVGFIR